ncbi:serine/threonine protein kinase [Janthinobacterium sp. HH01]|uniref:anti-sigma regulatory factor n=1 Tax=Janthinobacterium sp. HH01 TaxID=1198452 RepID=UPI0002AEE137|nr:anti-sigma regulatory factor [Janthinobacterium sp. HH01]ELX07995.1 serine/threonine protein kinase [Janthinobacterium sp. HH01]
MNNASAPTAVRFTSRLLDGGGKVQSSSTLPLHTDEHVVGVRKVVREHALDMKLSLVEQTKLVTAASELARNTIKYGGGGMVLAQTLSDGVRHGLRLVFADDGPGIADIAQALRDGYTSGGGLGLGLGGAKRLVDEFDIDSRSGEGTAVAITKWKK